MRSDSPSRASEHGAILGWSAVATASLAVLAWAACCILPIALSLSGISLAGAALVAGQRTWFTFGAAVVLSAGWWSWWRRRRACALDASCPLPPRPSIWSLSAATALMLLAMIWRPLIEPTALALLRAVQP